MCRGDFGNKEKRKKWITQRAKQNTGNLTECSSCDLMSQTTDIESNHKGNESFPYNLHYLHIYITYALEQDIESLQLHGASVLYLNLTSDLSGWGEPSYLHIWRIQGWNQCWAAAGETYVIHVLARFAHGWLLHSSSRGWGISDDVTCHDHSSSSPKKTKPYSLFGSLRASIRVPPLNITVTLQVSREYKKF